MRKIGIITSSCGKSGTYGCNYGAALQGYALVMQLRELGFDAYDIKYISDNEYRPQHYNVLKRTLLRLPLLLNPKQVKGKIEQIKKRNVLNLNLSYFKDFVNQNNLTYNNGAFYTLQELKNESSSFFAFITGSDVVWNPYLHKNVNDPGYFLDFTEKDIKRISYAASFGVTVLPEESRRTLKSLLEKFDAVSVRENSGAELIKRETGLSVKVVLDPTLLLDPVKYNDIECDVSDLPSKYIAVYRFGNLEHTDQKIREISRKLNLPIVFIPSGRTNEYNVRYDVGPGEFIHIIKHADLVLSDSFHCTVFCLINHIPFLTFYRSKPLNGKDINSRMIDLLNTVDLTNRIVEPGKEINYETLFQIDFTEPDEIIKKMRMESLQFLKKALEI